MSESAAATHPVDLCIHARWIAPVEPAGVVLERHALLIRNGCIEAIVPSTEVDTARCEETIHLDEHLLTPGLVNAHGHAAMSLFRGLADDLPLEQWLQQHIWPAEQRWVDPTFVRDGALLAIGEMLRSGTTTFSDMYYFPEETARAAAETGMRAQLCFPILDFPTAWGSGPDEYMEKGLALHDQWRDSEQISVGFGPHAPYTVSAGPLERVAALCHELDLPVQMHVHETRTEVDDFLHAKGMRPIAWLAELGVLGPRFQCVHLTQLDKTDVRTLHDNGCHVIHCPQSNLKLASGICPVQTLRDAGINVALGTDGAASNNDLDLVGEMQSAAMLAKYAANNAAALPAQEVLAMATLGGAKALGLDDRLGSLVRGKWADCIAVRLDDWQQLPVYDPVSQFVYSAGGHAVTDAWVGGKALMRGRTLQTVEARPVLAKARTWASKIRVSEPSD